MGAWGSGSFENDSALDWVSDLNQQNDLTFIIETLEATHQQPVVIIQRDYSDSNIADTAIAAAEVVAALIGKPGVNLPTDVQAWVSEQKLPISNEVRELASAAVIRILETSELRDLWAETEDYDAWYRGVKDLLARLQ